MTWWVLIFAKLKLVWLSHSVDMVSCSCDWHFQELDNISYPYYYYINFPNVNGYIV